MFQRILFSALLVSATGLFTGIVPAVAQEQGQQSEQVYGRQLMSPEELDEFRTKMRSLPNEEERNKLREEHHNQMKERAEQQGLSLPDTPPAQGGGMGPGGQGKGFGDGMGRGRESGRGMGQGGGRRGPGDGGKR